MISLENIKTAGLILTTTLVGWQVIDRIDIPDSIQPATVQGVHDEINGVVVKEIEPLKAGDKANMKNWALRNIPYNIDLICDGAVSGERLLLTRAEFRRELRNYEAATGMRHWYADMNEVEICDERKHERLR